jgi:hypothetical protein
MKTKYVIGISLILAIVSGIALANPQILTFDYPSNQWKNDHNEVVDASVVTSYTQTSYPTPWEIEVISPTLEYQNEKVYSNGEVITIQVSGMGTMTLTANNPISIRVT